MSMTRGQLKRLLIGADPVKRFRTVSQIMPRGRYRVIDAAGAASVVESAAIWQVGDQVTVIDGRIVGPARRFARRKTFRV